MCIEDTCGICLGQGVEIKTMKGLLELTGINQFPNDPGLGTLTVGDGNTEVFHYTDVGRNSGWPWIRPAFKFFLPLRHPVRLAMLYDMIQGFMGPVPIDLIPCR